LEGAPGAAAVTAAVSDLVTVGDYTQEIERWRAKLAAPPQGLPAAQVRLADLLWTRGRLWDELAQQGPDVGVPAEYVAAAAMMADYDRDAARSWRSLAKRNSPRDHSRTPRRPHGA
jgi:hypothetical protein